MYSAFSRRRNSLGFAQRVEAMFAQHAVKRLQAVEDRFKAIDKEKNRELSYQDFIKVLKESGASLTKKEFEELLAEYDENGDGKKIGLGQNVPFTLIFPFCSLHRFNFDGRVFASFPVLA